MFDLKKKIEMYIIFSQSVVSLAKYVSNYVKRYTFSIQITQCFLKTNNRAHFLIYHRNTFIYVLWLLKDTLFTLVELIKIHIL